MIIEEKDVARLEEILSSRERVIIDFWAPWCKPCEDLERELEYLVDSYDCGDLVVVRVNASEAQEAVLRYKVLGLPTLLIYVNGELKSRMTGIQRAETIAEVIGCRERS